MKAYVAFLLLLGASPNLVSAEETRTSQTKTERRLASYLERHPGSDANKDGVLTLDEFRGYRNSAEAVTDMEQRLARLLRRLPEADADGNGVLTIEELRAFQQERREARKERESGEAGSAEDSTPQRSAQEAGPTHPDYAYGDHEKQRFDLWTLPDAEAPTPLVVFIHGGGFRGGDKKVAPGVPRGYLEEGVAFASMNYRLSDVGPYPIMMHDAARGLQTIRHRAGEWNIDPDRVVCYGGSAGAGISLWLAFHDDLAEPGSDDPIARQSTRLLAAGTLNGQSTYDMHTYREWFGVPDLPIHSALPAFLGIESGAELDEEPVRARMRDASPIEHLSKDDEVAVYMSFSRPDSEVTRETSQAVWVHHVLLGRKLQEAMQELGLECHVTAPGLPAENDPYGSLEAFLLEQVRR